MDMGVAERGVLRELPKNSLQEKKLKPSIAGFWLAAWGAFVVTIFVSLVMYQSTPGRAADAPVQWPSDIARNEGWTAVVVIHPRCSCTRASLFELQRLMVTLRGRVEVVAYFVMPTGSGRDWTDTALWRQASAIEDVQLVADDGGEIANLFGVHASGQLLLYDDQEQLRFAGGITAGRGHEGDSSGRLELLAALEGVTSHGQASVFGCSVDERGAEGGAQ